MSGADPAPAVPVEPELDPDDPVTAGPAAVPPAWTQPEIAWAIAIVAGFGGSWLGMLVGLPGAAEVVATAAFVPLHLRLTRDHGSSVAGLLSLGWALGFAGAVLGAVLDDQGAMVRAAFPLGGPYAARAIAPWLGGAPAPAPGLLWPSLAWVVAVPVAAWATRGAAGLLLAAAAVGGVAAGTAEWALAAVQAGAGPILASLACAPPSAVVALAGVLVAASAAAVRSPPSAAGGTRAVAARRGVLAVGMAAASLAVLAEPWVAPHWGRAVRRFLPL